MFTHKSFGSVFGFFRKPENSFLFFGLVFGLMILFITPPFQAPDEQTHLFRAYQLSQGGLIAEKQAGRVGGFLPRGLQEAWAEFSYMRFFPENKTTSMDIVNFFHKDFEEKDLFVVFGNTALYSPIPYLFQSVVIAPLSWFSLNPLVYLYVGRLASLLSWCAILFFAIKIMPFHKWMYMLIILMPMSIFQGALLTADSTTYALSFFLTAYILYLAFDDRVQKVSRKQLYILFIVSVLLSLAKQSYFLLPALSLLIPVKKFSSRKQYISVSIGLIISNLIAIGLWSYAIGDVYVIPKPNVDPKEQLMFIFKHPLEYAKIILDDFVFHGRDYLEKYVGQLGWLDTHLSNPFKFFYFVNIWLLMFLVPLPKKVVITARQKLILLGIFVLSLVLVETVLYLSWTPVWSFDVEGMQGRYLIPIMPMFFLLFIQGKKILCASLKKLWIYINIVTFLSLIFVIIRLLDRYYG